MAPRWLSFDLCLYPRTKQSSSELRTDCCGRKLTEENGSIKVYEFASVCINGKNLCTLYSNSNDNDNDSDNDSDNDNDNDSDNDNDNDSDSDNGNTPDAEERQTIFVLDTAQDHEKKWFLG